MEESLLISYLNDFTFCPVSIYFHKLYGNLDKMVYQEKQQLCGTNAHRSIDQGSYSSRKSILQSTPVYCKKFNLQGKIDIFDIEKNMLIERKNKIQKIYDGYIFQMYGQYYCLVEMGYSVKKLRLHSMRDNKNYDIKLPNENIEKDTKFRTLIKEINEFDISKFKPQNISKCENCIYEPLCDRSLLC